MAQFVSTAWPPAWKLRGLVPNTPCGQECRTALAGRCVLDLRGYNLSGTEDELKKRLELYNDGKILTDYDNMEKKELFDIIDLFSIEGMDIETTERSVVLHAVRTHILPGNKKRKPPPLRGNLQR